MTILDHEVSKEAPLAQFRPCRDFFERRRSNFGTQFQTTIQLFVSVLASGAWECQKAICGKPPLSKGSGRVTNGWTTSLQRDLETASHVSTKDPQLCEAARSSTVVVKRTRYHKLIIFPKSMRQTTTGDHFSLNK